MSMDFALMTTDELTVKAMGRLMRMNRDSLTEFMGGYSRKTDPEIDKSLIAKARIIKEREGYGHWNKLGMQQHSSDYMFKFNRFSYKHHRDSLIRSIERYESRHGELK